MTKGLMQLSVFVSCPGGMDKYVKRVKVLVAHENPRWQNELDVTTRVLSFEDVPSSYSPGGPQAAVNAELFGRYDIYLGLMGHRFGTPTTAYGSGTEEEYRLAVEEHLAHRAPQHVAFGFCQEPVDPFTVDPDELARVKAFRRALGANQIYFTWKNSKEFGEKVTSQLNTLVFRIAEKPVIGGARYGRDPRVS